jgi:hypothetical protein
MEAAKTVEDMPAAAAQTGLPARGKVAAVLMLLAGAYVALSGAGDLLELRKAYSTTSNPLSWLQGLELPESADFDAPPVRDAFQRTVEIFRSWVPYMIGTELPFLICAVAAALLSLVVLVRPAARLRQWAFLAALLACAFRLALGVAVMQTVSEAFPAAAKIMSAIEKQNAKDLNDRAALERKLGKVEQLVNAAGRVAASMSLAMAVGIAAFWALAGAALAPTRDRREGEPEGPPASG